MALAEVAWGRKRRPSLPEKHPGLTCRPDDDASGLEPVRHVAGELNGVTEAFEGE